MTRSREPLTLVQYKSIMKESKIINLSPGEEWIGLTNVVEDPQQQQLCL